MPPLPRPTVSRRSTSQPWGVRKKLGSETIPRDSWEAILAFVTDQRNWMLDDDPALPRDREDPLTARPTKGYGAFMMGFDFHLTADGPKLIEVNTNAGGLATVLDLEGRSRSGRSARPADELLLEAKFVEALKSEAAAGGGAGAGVLRHVCIVDDDVTAQRLYPEMLRLRDVVRSAGIACTVASPEQVRARAEDGRLVLVDGHGAGAGPIDLIYNRLAPDFRLTEKSHAHLREAALRGTVVVTPHPAVYCRAADKRQLPKLFQRQQEAQRRQWVQGARGGQRHRIVPETRLLSSRPLEDWWASRNDYVFKPPDGHGSRGVRLGPALRQRDLRAMGPETVVQRLWAPADCTGGEKNCSFDLRVYTVGPRILACTTRQFGKGGKMEMSSAVSGFKKAVPAEGVASFREVVDPESLTLLNTSLRILHHLQQRESRQQGGPGPRQPRHPNQQPKDCYACAGLPNDDEGGAGLPGPVKLARMTTNEFKELRAKARSSAAAAAAAAASSAAAEPAAAAAPLPLRVDGTSKKKPKTKAAASTFRTVEELAADARAKETERERAKTDVRQQAELRLRKCTGTAMRAMRAKHAQGTAEEKKNALQAFSKQLAELKKELLAGEPADLQRLEEIFRARYTEMLLDESP